MTPAVFLAAFTYFFVPILIPIFRNQNRESYQGYLIPTGLGIAFLLPAAAVMIGLQRDHSHTLFFASLVLFFGFLGFVDDCLGDAKVKGFRGHLGSKKMTTGGLKAAGGVLISLIIGFFYASHWLEVIVNGLLIALSANFMNLLDLRPGRAGKVFLIFATTLLLCYFPALQPLFWLQAALVGYLRWDLLGRVMMGDTGSNSLGAALGFALVVAVPCLTRFLFLLVLVGLNLLGERRSFSRLIEENRFLRFLDQIGRGS